MMEKAWQLFLRQIGADDPEFTYDEVCGWSADEFEALTGAGLIGEMAQATHVACEVCPEAHWERVRWSEDGKRAFIPCPVAGTVDVNPERLRQWRADLTRFTTLLARSFALTGETRTLPAAGLWFLGRRRVGGSTPYFFFGAVSPEGVSSAVKAIQNAYGRVAGTLLVPVAPLDCVEDGKLRIIDVGRAVTLVGREIQADIEFVEQQFMDGRHSFGPQSQAKKPGNALTVYRRGILLAAIRSEQVADMGALARKLGVSPTALRGMVRGDKTRYSDEKLASVLKKLECSPATWNRVPKSAGRK